MILPRQICGLCKTRRWLGFRPEVQEPSGLEFQRGHLGQPALTAVEKCAPGSAMSCCGCSRPCEGSETFIQPVEMTCRVGDVPTHHYQPIASVGSEGSPCYGQTCRGGAVQWSVMAHCTKLREAQPAGGTHACSHCPQQIHARGGGQRRGYVAKRGGALEPTPRGRLLAAFLGAYFGRYVDYGFTAALEDSLDAVSGAALAPLPGTSPDIVRLAAACHCLVEP